MRRKDRQVTDFAVIKEIIANCDSIRLAFNDGDCPYIVPLNFGTEYVGEQIIFYVHGAATGKKKDLIEKLGKCGFEMDCNHTLQLLPADKDVTMRYNSIIGKADIELVAEEDKERALNILMGHFDETKNYEWNPAVMPKTMVAKITVTEYTGKINPVSK